MIVNLYVKNMILEIFFDSFDAQLEDFGETLTMYVLEFNLSMQPYLR